MKNIKNLVKLKKIFKNQFKNAKIENNEKQVAGAGFGGLLWDIWKLEKAWDKNRKRTPTHTEK